MKNNNRQLDRINSHFRARTDQSPSYRGSKSDRILARIAQRLIQRTKPAQALGYGERLV